MSERGGGPRVEGSALRERWARGDRAWVYGGDRAIALRVHEARGELVSLSAAGDVLRWDLATGTLKSKQALAVALRDRTRARTTDDGQREPCLAGRFDAGGDRVQVLIGDNPEKLWIFDARTGRRIAECADDPLATPNPRNGFDANTRIDGFSRDGASVLGAMRSSIPDEVGSHPWSAFVWDATTGDVRDQWDCGAAPLWSAARHSIFYLARRGGLRRRMAPDLWSGEEWDAEVPALVDGELLLSGDGSVVIAYGVSWPPRAVVHVVAVDTRSGAVRWSTEHPLRARSRVGATSIDGALLLFETDRVEAYDIATGEPCAPPSDAHEAMKLATAPRAYSQRQTRHYAACDGVVRRFFPGSVEDDNEAAELVGAVANVALSRSGARALTLNHAGTLRLWDARAGEAEQRLETEGDALAPCGVVMSPDERQAFAMKPGRLVRWSLESGVCAGESALVTKASVFGRRAFAVASPLAMRLAAMSPDGGQLIALSQSSEIDALIAFDAHTGQRAWTADVESECAPSARYAVDEGQHVVLVGVGGEALIVGFDRETGSALWESPDLVDFDETVSAVFPTDAECGWCVADGYLREFDGNEVLRWENHVSGLPVAPPYARSEDGRWLVTGSPTGDALLWSIREGYGAPCVGRIDLASTHDRVASADFDARGETLLIGTERGLLLCYDLRAY